MYSSYNAMEKIYYVAATIDCKNFLEKNKLSSEEYREYLEKNYPSEYVERLFDLYAL